MEDAEEQPTGEWRSSNASKLRKIVDPSVDEARRLDLFLGFAKELEKRSLFRSLRDKQEAQLLELDLWDFLLAEDLNEDMLLVIQNSIILLLCREEFFLTENGITSVDFPVKSAMLSRQNSKPAASAAPSSRGKKSAGAKGGRGKATKTDDDEEEEEGEEEGEEEEEEVVPRSRSWRSQKRSPSYDSGDEGGDVVSANGSLNDLDILVEYRNLAWKTLTLALDQLLESYIMTSTRRYLIQVFAISMVLFPQFEQSMLHILSAMSPPLPPDLASFYPAALSQELPAGGIDQFFYPDYPSSTWKQIVCSRLVVEDLMRSVFNDPCYDYISKPFLTGAINLFGWKSFEKLEPKSCDYNEHLRRFIVSDGFVFFEFISAYFRSLRRFGGEAVIHYQYIPSFFVIYRIAIPALQGTLLSKFSLAQQDVSDLPSYCYAEALACCSYLLAYPHTINFVLRFVLQPCNLFHFGDFSFATETLKTCFSTIRQFECPEKEIKTAANPFVTLGAMFKRDGDFPFTETRLSKFCFHQNTLANWLLRRGYARDEKEAQVYMAAFLRSGMAIKCPKTKKSFMIPKSLWVKRDFINKEPLRHCLSSMFDYAYFGSFLKMVCSSDNHQVLITTLTFLYNSLDMVRGEWRKEFVIHCLLDDLFRFLFYHWSHEVRLCYFDILIYKVYAGSRSTLPTLSSDTVMELAGLQAAPKVSVVTPTIPELFGGVMNGLRKAVNRIRSRPERNVFEEAMENESDAMDIVICSKIESRIKEVCLFVKRLDISPLDERERKYAKAALLDYVQQVRTYQEKLQIEGPESLQPPELTFGFQFSKTIYD